jgi:hypothetical protein
MRRAIEAIDSPEAANRTILARRCNRASPFGWRTIS